MRMSPAYIFKLTQEGSARGKRSYCPAFRWKMALLAAAVLFYFTVRRRALLRTDHGGSTLWARTPALISLASRWNCGPCPSALLRITQAHSNP